MPRRARYYLPDVPQHLIQRGNNQQTIFFCPNDYEFYLDCLRDASECYSCVLHAYVLMPNHVHLLVTPHNADSLPRMMQSIGRCFVQHINHANQRTGTLWEGRYRACLVEPHEYLLECTRYIEMNPVRHGLVTVADDHPWSSIRHHAWGKTDALVKSHARYLELGDCDLERQETYRRLLASPMEPDVLREIRESLNHNRVLGSLDFQKRLERLLARPVRTGKPGRPRKHLPLNRTVNAYRADDNRSAETNSQ